MSTSERIADPQSSEDLPPGVRRLRAEHREDTPVVGTPRPRLSWMVDSRTGDWRQHSAEVSLERAGEHRAVELPGEDSVLVPWPFDELVAGETVRASVRVTGVDGIVSPWSEPLTIEAGFLAENDWRATPIGLADPVAPAQPCLLRDTFAIEGEVTRARLVATAHGVYQVEVNGSEVDDAVLKPGWTVYPERLDHENTDVTALLKPGTNAIGVWLAGGWFTEQYGFHGQARRVYGEHPAVALQVHVDYADGRHEVVTSDAGWRATGDGPLRSSGIYAGEHYDARQARQGWSQSDFDDSTWSPVRVDGGPWVVPTPTAMPPVRRTQELPVQQVLTSPSGKLILDFGQNLVGRLRLRVRGRSGHRLTLRHAEVLEDGELALRPLRMAEATDSYVLAGDGEEVWEPRFTFHGFRYAQLDDWPGEFDPDDVIAVVLHNDMRRTGWFETSDPLLNRLHENAVWGMRGNFLALPTDCPQRDERLGWTGDIQVFTPTASYLYDSLGFLSSWLRDLAVEQRRAGGVVPLVVPSVLPSPLVPTAAWGDAATIVPWQLYQRFGDLGVLTEQYPSMREWTDLLLSLRSEAGLWEEQQQLGDWLDPTAPPERAADAKASPDIVASAHLFRSTDLLAEAAATLGHAEDAEYYGAEAERIRTAFLAAFVTPAGRMASDAQTAYALALSFGISRDPAQRQALGDRLAALVRRGGYHIGTGFVGTPLITDALTDTGHLDVAEKLLTQTECPSWLYPVTQGATTIWERWDSMLEDGSINPGEMTSFNHYALGAVADWLHRVVAGLAPAAPGYRALRIEPRPLDSLDHAAAGHETPYGVAEVSWRREGEQVAVRAVVPAGTTATVALPDGSPEFTVGSGSHEWAVPLARASTPRTAVSGATSLADLVDDREAYQAVVAAIAAHDPAWAADFRKHTTWFRGTTLEQAMQGIPTLPPPVVEAVREALDALTAERTGTA